MIVGVKMMRIGICDDEVSDLSKLKKLVTNYIDYYHINIDIMLFNTINSLLSSVDSLDCLILDVLLNNTTGIKLAKQIRQLNPELKIIFCSTNPEYSIDAFEVDAFRYLVKPVQKDKLFGYLDDVRKFYDDSLLIFKDIKQRLRKISILDICYIDMDRRKSNVHLKNKSVIVVVRQMKEWQQILEKHRFYVSHKGILVNIRQVFAIDDNKLIMKNGDTVYLSRLYKTEFINTFYAFLDETI